MKKYEFFKVEGNKINRIRRHCPKCGPAVFIAEHKDRFSCGKCGYTEFKSGGKKESKDVVKEEKNNVEVKGSSSV
jgi:ubiquitin-small subunit ribosomal protein S27Ae